MSEPYIGQICLFGFNFAPRSYAFCAGQLIPISQNEALFSILGTTYGGNGQSNFALPNFQDRGVVNMGQGPGLSNYDLGEAIGSDTVTLNSNQIPMHNHTVNAFAGSTQALAPSANAWFGSNSPPGRIYSDQPATGTMALNVVSGSGGSQPHMNEQPYLGMNFCIALYGIYPSRN
ncbi:MAG: phage tail protein [Proteobacteria bacterium]|nr:phage tail protein [Pseudomonadota bacterium]